MLPRLLLFVIVLALLGAVLLIGLQPGDAPRVSGVVEADEIRVGSLLGGRVAQVLVVEGQAVVRGEVLVELEPHDLLARVSEARARLAERRAVLSRLESGFRPEEVAQASARCQQLQAQLEKLENGPRPQEIAAARAEADWAQAQLDLDRHAFERTRQLFEAGKTTQLEMDRAHKAVDASVALQRVRSEQLALLLEGSRNEDIAAAKAALAEAVAARQLLQAGYRSEELVQARSAVEAAVAALQAVSVLIEELSIRAPIDGLVEAVDLREGDLISPQAPVVSIADTSRLWLRAFVPENRLDLQLGQQLEISVDSFPERRFHGELSFIARQAEFSPRNVQTADARSQLVFRVKIEIVEGRALLRPGTNADVWLPPAPEPAP